MVEKLQQTLRDSAVARWTVLVLVASMMFFAYMFVDILSPLASLLEQTPHLGWNQEVFGTYAAGEYLLNGPAPYLDFLYQVGLGSNNSQGFGMFEMTDYDA